MTFSSLKVGRSLSSSSVCPVPFSSLSCLSCPICFIPCLDPDDKQTNSVVLWLRLTEHAQLRLSPTFYEHSLCQEECIWRWTLPAPLGLSSLSDGLMNISNIISSYKFEFDQTLAAWKSFLFILYISLESTTHMWHNSSIWGEKHGSIFVDIKLGGMSFYVPFVFLVFCLYLWRISCSRFLGV